MSLNNDWLFNLTNYVSLLELHPKILYKKSDKSKSRYNPKLRILDCNFNAGFPPPHPILADEWLLQEAVNGQSF